MNFYRGKNGKLHVGKRANEVRKSIPSPDDGLLEEFIRDMPEGLTIDHIIPKCHGGQLDIGNVQWLTRDRNNKKGNKYWWLHPYLPTCQPYGVHHLC